jgi:hypothetical protein
MQDLALQLPNLSQRIKNTRRKNFPFFFLYGVEKKKRRGGAILLGAWRN